MTGKSIALFVVAAIAEIGGAYLVWQYARENCKRIGSGSRGRGPDRLPVCRHAAAGNNFGRVLAAYGGVFVAGSLLWGAVFDGFRPDRFDLIGAVV